MNRLGVGQLGGAHDRLDVEIAAGAGGRADADALVGNLHVQRFAVGIGVHGDSLNAEFLAGTDDTQGDLAPVCNQYFVKHLFFSAKQGKVQG